MPILIGTDEAGYGPNLGPLVVAATAWRVPASDAPVDLYERLAEVVSAGGSAGLDAASEASFRLAIADSKALYHPGGGLAALERGVLAALSSRTASCSPASWRDIFFALAPNSARTLLAAPWFRDYDCPVPIDVDASELALWSDRLSAGLRRADVGLCDLRATVVGPAEFNREVRQRGSKGSLLTDTTLALVEQLVAELGASTSVPPADESFLVTCDKHGGRNRYMGPLQHAFPDDRIEALSEGRESSRYRLSRRGRMVTIEFRARGERWLPAALASMTAKYLRELSMRAFNSFWSNHVPGLQPTAGYPVDARRFHDNIRSAQTRLGISDDQLWRER